MTTLHLCRKGTLPVTKQNVNRVIWKQGGGVRATSRICSSKTFPSSSWKSRWQNLVVCTLSICECVYVFLNQKLTVLQHCWKGSCFSVVANCTPSLTSISLADSKARRASRLYLNATVFDPDTLSYGHVPSFPFIFSNWLHLIMDMMGV